MSIYFVRMWLKFWSFLLYLFEQEKQGEEYAFSDLQKKLGIFVSFTSMGPQIVEESEDKEFCELGLRLIEENSLIEKVIFQKATPDFSLVNCNCSLPFTNVKIWCFDICLWWKGSCKINEASKALRDHWKNSNFKSVPLKELGPLLRDYQRLIFRRL